LRLPGVVGLTPRPAASAGAVEGMAREKAEA
jgi:hypothetical protein